MSGVKVDNGQQNKEQKGKRVAFGMCMLFVLTATCIVFSILCLYATKVVFFSKNTTLFCVLIPIGFFTLFTLAVWFFYTEKQTLFKTLLSAFIFILFCLILIYIFQKTGFFEVVKDEKTLQNYLEKKGAWMPIVYVLLQYLQVVILPIPSVVSTLAGVALFGAFKTVLYSLIGILLGSVTAFFIGRKLGYKAVSWMVGEETLNKWQKKLKGKDNILLTFMFLLPVFPDDVLCFVAGLSSMSTRYFLIMILVSRILSVSTTCYSIQLIPLNEWWGIGVWAGIMLLVLLAFVFVYKYMDKMQAFFKRFQRKK